jgi:predicted nucleic acid-binding protein
VARILVDSDVLVDHLRGTHRLSPGRDEVHVSSITRAELFAGRQTDASLLRRLLSAMTEIPIDAGIAERAGKLGRASAARLPDMLIAATAIEHGLTLVTRNVRPFESVRGLRIRTAP